MNKVVLITALLLFANPVIADKPLNEKSGEEFCKEYLALSDVEKVNYHRSVGNNPERNRKTSYEDWLALAQAISAACNR